MQPRTLHELRGALGNADARVRRTIRAPRGLADTDWDGLDYLGWRDPSALQRGYLFVEREGDTRGVLLLHARAEARPARAVMCTLCRIPRRFDQVVLFSGPTLDTLAGKNSSTGGSYLCADLRCNARVNALAPTGPLDPPAAELVAGARAALSQRAHAFVDALLGTA